jgi:CBS domain-containing protein
VICPFCKTDNISGVDACAACGQSLVEFEEPAGELENAIARHPVSVLAPREPVSVPPSCTAREAVRLLALRNIGSLLVVEDGRPVGIFTERDVLARISADPARLDRPVADSMTAPPVVVHKQDSLAYALHCMSLGGYRHLPIVDKEGRAAGIVSVRDILRFLCIRFAEIRNRLR